MNTIILTETAWKFTHFADFHKPSHIILGILTIAAFRYGVPAMRKFLFGSGKKK